MTYNENTDKCDFPTCRYWQGRCRCQDCPARPDIRNEDAYDDDDYTNLNYGWEDLTTDKEI